MEALLEMGKVQLWSLPASLQSPLPFRWHSHVNFFTTRNGSLCSVIYVLKYDGET